MSRRASSCKTKPSLSSKQPRERETETARAHTLSRVAIDAMLRIAAANARAFRGVIAPRAPARPARRVHVARASSDAAGDDDAAQPRDDDDDPERAKPIDATLIETMQNLRKTRPRPSAEPAPTTTVMASAETNDEWRELDAKVNEYPCARKFQAIGVDDGDFVESVRGMISNALGGRHIHPENVTSRPSSKGKYVSANVTVEMRSGDEVLAVYATLKADKRVLWYL